MKALHYDTEGDILSVTFDETDTETSGQKQTGIELSDNLVLYYNPETEQPLELILISYQALLQASAQMPIVLDGLTETPEPIRATITALLKRAPLTAFLQLIEQRGNTPRASRLQAVFTPDALQIVTAN
jgi:hypothetical protein